MEELIGFLIMSLGITIGGFALFGTELSLKDKVIWSVIFMIFLILISVGVYIMVG